MKSSEELIQLNNIARNRTNHRIQIRGHKKDNSCYGGYMIRYADSILRSDCEAPLGDIIDMLSYGEICISNIGALCSIINSI